MRTVAMVERVLIAQSRVGLVSGMRGSPCVDRMGAGKPEKGENAVALATKPIAPPRPTRRPGEPLLPQPILGIEPR